MINYVVSLQYGVDIAIFLVTWYFILFLNFGIDTNGL